MKLALFAAVALAAPGVFAQSSLATTDTTVMGAGPSTVIVSRSNSGVSDFPFLRGAAIAAEPVAPATVVGADTNTAVMGAPAVPVVRHWWNVPADVSERQDFRRWRGLM